MSLDSHLYNNIANNNSSNLTEDQIHKNNSKHSHHDYNKGKKKSQLPEVDPNAPCFIQQLSVELFTHIFARLDPISLATAAKVCTYWRHIVNDDSCWRDAFVAYFGCLPLKRLSLESWKTEYILRTHLIRKWTKGRGTVMSFIPKIGSIESMYTNFDDSSLIVASMDEGVAAKCNPKTGKIDRHLLYSTNEGVRVRLTATKVDKDRILWGFDAGFITLSIRTKSSGAVTSNRLKTFSDFHQGAVRVLALPSHLQDVVLSGGEDGQVKIWDIFSTACAWTFYPASALARQPTCIEVSVDQRVIIGYDDGSVVIWNVNMNRITQTYRNSHQEDYSRKRDELRKDLESKRIVIGTPSVSPSSAGARISVKMITYDPETHMLIVAYDGHTDVRKYDAETGNLVGVFSYGHMAATGITCMKWDIVPTSTVLSLESALKPRSSTTNSNNRKKGGNIIDLSSSSSSKTASGQVTPAIASSPSVKTTRVLVTGDDMGGLCLWNGDAMNGEDGHSIKPIRILSGHLVAISAIYIDACKIVTGSDDGWIRMWDPLTGININTLGNKIPKGAPVDRTDVNVMRVKNIWCNDYQGVATIGHQVKAWDFSPGKQFLTRGALKGKHAGKPCNNVVRDRIRYEIGREVKESIQKLESEKFERERNEREFNKLSLGGLTDEEMLDYAMMLSEQDSGGSGTAAAGSRENGDFIDEDDEELMKAVIASLDLIEKENGMENNKEEVFDDEESIYVNDMSSAASVDTGSIDTDSMHDEWPTVTESHGSGTTSRQILSEEEELRDRKSVV